MSRLEERPTGRGGGAVREESLCPCSKPVPPQHQDDSGQDLHLEPLPAPGRPRLTSARGLCMPLPSHQPLPTSLHQRPWTPAQWDPPQSSLPSRRRPGLAVSLCTPGVPAVVPPHASQRSPASYSGAPKPRIPIHPHSPEPHHTPLMQGPLLCPSETSRLPPSLPARSLPPFQSILLTEVG